MRTVLHIAALGIIFTVTSVAWLVLAGVTDSRSWSQRHALSGEVSSLWGAEIRTATPSLRTAWTTTDTKTETWRDADGATQTKEVEEVVSHHADQRSESGRVRIDVREDVRRKGLVWYPLYDIDFEGAWTYTHTDDQAAELVIDWSFPDPTGFYDDFALTVGGAEQEGAVQADSGRVHHVVPVALGDVVELGLRWRSRGSTSFWFQPSPGVAEIRDLEVVVTTDFADIDFPSGSLSPTDRERAGGGWALTWDFDRLLTGKGIGVIVPNPVQPGELVSAMSMSAPISLGLFMAWILVLGVVRGIDIHPMNHVFLAGAFFSFHLLFGYSADWIPVEMAFGLSAVVSLFLVVSYLRRVVSPAFAWKEAGLAQLVYLVGFAGAHFLDGATGLTLTVLGIGTLYVLMQLTADVRWTEVLAGVGRDQRTVGKLTVPEG